MSITASELGILIGAEVVGDSDVILEGVAKIEEATPSEITFVANKGYRKFLESSKAAAVILDEVPEDKKATYLVTSEPYMAFLKALRFFHPEKARPEKGIHPSAFVSSEAHLG